jgi:hypothetical protein
MGIRSDPRLAGGLPVPDIDVLDIEGDKEYWRLSGILIGADAMRWLDDEVDEP